MARPDQILRMKKLNVQPSFLMNHVRFYGAAYRDQIFGPERTAFTDPAGACVKADLPFTLAYGCARSPPGPLALVSTAMTRRCVIHGSIIGSGSGRVARPPPCALGHDRRRAPDRTRLSHRLARKGEGSRPRPSRNGSYKTSPDKLDQIKVSETWVAGEKKHGA